MSDDLLGYYEAEFAALTQLAAAFAKENPSAADALHLPRPNGKDPHVERLLEGAAFLGARVQQRLDDEFPELTDALLGVLYPHYLAPFPSCMMAQLTPRKDLQRPAEIKQHTLVQTELVDGTACRFRTTAPVTLWPIEIESVRLTGLPLPTMPVRLATEAAGVLRITLRCLDSGMTFERLGLDRLRLHLTGGEHDRHALYELLCGHVVAVAFADRESDPRPVVCPASAVQPVGFGSDEAMLPWPAQGFSGFRLLSEYFAFPDKFLSVDIAGIGGKCDAGAGHRLEIFLYLDQMVPRLERIVGPSSLALGCVPLVNLFPHRCEPIDLDWTRAEYRVDPGLRRAKSMEVWSVEKVREIRLDGTERPWRPFFRMVHGDADSGQAAGSYLAMRRPAPPGLTGSDVFLAVDDPSFDPARTTRTRLSVEALCTNRDLPEALPTAFEPVKRPALKLEAGSASIDRIEPLSPATATLRPPPHGGQAGGQRFWRLISHLSLSHLSIVGGSEGASVLREVLKLYDLRDDTRSRAVIAALRAVSAAPGTARLPGAPFGSFCRGVDVRLTFEPQAWQSSGLYLLAAVLEQFLRLHGTVNGFVRCAALLPGQNRPVAQWPPRAGTRSLL
jgi:type VI secretion system protein ImpG